MYFYNISRQCSLLSLFVVILCRGRCLAFPSNRVRGCNSMQSLEERGIFVVNREHQNPETAKSRAQASVHMTYLRLPLSSSRRCACLEDINAFSMMIMTSLRRSQFPGPLDPRAPPIPHNFAQRNNSRRPHEYTFFAGPQIPCGSTTHLIAQSGCLPLTLPPEQSI